MQVTRAPSLVWEDPTSARFSRSVVSDSLWPHGLQQTSLPCSWPAPGASSNSCLLSRWCYPTISSSVVPFSSSLQSFHASGSFPMSQFFASGGQNIRASASASALPVNIQDWFLLGLTGPCSSRDSQKSFPTPQFKSGVWEDPTCCETTKPMHPNYEACSLESWVHMLQLLKPARPRAHVLQQEKPLQWEVRALQLVSSSGSNEDAAQSEIKINE